MIHLLRKHEIHNTNSTEDNFDSKSSSQSRWKVLEFPVGLAFRWFVFMLSICNLWPSSPEALTGLVVWITSAADPDSMWPNLIYEDVYRINVMFMIIFLESPIELHN